MPLSPCTGSGPKQVGRSLRWFAAIGLILFLATYVLFALTHLGQGVGDAADLGRVALSAARRTEYGHLLERITTISMVVMVIVVGIVGYVRKAWLPALAAIGSFAVADVAAEVLKRMLPRPELSVLEEQLKYGGQNTFPSGHATIATSFALAVILVSAPKWRPWVGIAGSVWAATVCAGTLAAGWHRPSDAYGGIALASAVFGLAASVLVTSSFASVSTPHSTRILLPGALLVVAVSALSLVGGIGRHTSNHPSPGVPAWAFPASFMVIVLLSVAAVAGFAALLRSVDPQPHQRGQPSGG